MNKQGEETENATADEPSFDEAVSSLEH